MCRLLNRLKKFVRRLIRRNKSTMGEIDRTWAPEFREYTEFIATHPNYKGLLIERNKDGNLGWVVTGKSAKGKVREAWWNKKMSELKAKNKAEVARRIHPTGKHVCQCCGRAMSIYYEYPNNRTCRHLNQILKQPIQPADYTIREIIENNASDAHIISGIAEIFSVKTYDSPQNLIEIIYKRHVATESGLLSPGVMSNPPDRFDGFHSDGLCCRSKTDKGRHKDNMKTYTQDRRAYEEWADGNYNLANRLMGEFSKGTQKYQCPQCNKMRKMSADHIGPISLGFCHSIYNFAPMCKSCNSSKNNRFTKSDVEALIDIEKRGKTVISWHSQYIWDALKGTITDDETAKRLSNIMVTCHQNVLKLFSVIYQQIGEEFLMHYLHPEYSKFDYRFENFNPLNLSTLKIIETELDSANKRSNSERVVRIAFEALEEFDKKDNRRTKFYIDIESPEFRDLISVIQEQSFEDADALIKKYIASLTQTIIDEEWN